METFSALLAICAGIHQSPVNFPPKGQWRSFDVYFDLRPTNRLRNNRETGDLRGHRAYYDIIVMGYVLFHNIPRYQSTLRPGQNGWYFSDKNFKLILSKENFKDVCF